MSVGDEVQVLIVGGGIGGLSLAGFLRAEGIDAVVVERHAAWDGDEYGLVLRRDGLRMAAELGVAEDLRSAGESIPAWTSREPSGATRCRREFEAERAPVAISREALHEALRGNVPASSIRMGTTLDSLDRSGAGVAATLSDGVRERFDVVVGADGVHSTVRELIDADSARFCGTATWSFLLEGGVDAPDAASDVWGPDGAAFLLLPMGNRTFVELVAAADDPGAFDGWSLETVRERFAGVEWFLPEALQAVDPGTVRHAADYRVTADTWRDGRVVLLGDAAHAVHPLAGVGASLAMADARVLAEELTGRGDDIELRLADYVGRRRSRLRRHRWAARRSSAVGTVDTVLLAKAREAITMRSSLLSSAEGDAGRALVGPESI